MAKLSEFLTGKKATQGQYVTDPYGQLAPEQKALLQQTGNFLSSKVAGSPETYTGTLLAEMSPEEQAIQSNASRLNALTNERFTDLMSGEFPEEYYQKAIYNPLMKKFQEDVQPLIEESYAGPGSYWGSARADAIRKGYRDIYDTLAGERVKLAKEARELPLQVAPIASDYNTSAAALASIPRSVKQLGLDKSYSEWVRGRTEKKDYIDRAMDFINLNSVSQTYVPGTPGSSGLVDYALEGLKQRAYDLTSGDMLYKALGSLTGGNTSGQQAKVGGTSNYSQSQIDALLAEPDYMKYYSL